jgi:hypothetical protein
MIKSSQQGFSQEFRRMRKSRFARESALGSASASRARCGALAATLSGKEKVRDGEAPSPAREGACAPQIDQTTPGAAFKVVCAICGSP